MNTQHLYSYEAEVSVLGIFLANSDLYIDTIDQLTPDHFYNNHNRNIYIAMQHVYQQTKSFDIISICQRVKDMDCGSTDSDVVEVLSGYHSTTGLTGYVKTLIDKHKRRQMFTISETITNRTVDPSDNIDTIVHDSLESITDVVSSQEDNTFDATIAEIDERIEEFEQSESDILGMCTGLSKLDNMLDGIQGGQFIGFAAYTSQGKTWDALNLAHNLIEDGKKVCFITLENSKAQILTRLASIHTGISDNKIKKGRTTPEEKLDIKDYMQKVVASGSTVYRSSKWEDIKTAITKEALVNKPDIFILDYLQIITGDKESVRLLEDIAGYLQNTLISIDIPMLALSQISNETAKGNVRDEVLKFKGSGAIGASVSTAIFKKTLHTREEIEERRQAGVPLESWWIVEKNRDGDYTGRVRTYFHPWSHKLWGEEEFAEEYGLERYEKQVRELSFELSDDDDTLSSLFNNMEI